MKSQFSRIDLIREYELAPDWALFLTTSAMIGTACGIKPKQQDDWMVVPNLWGGLIARPGMLKTPAVAEVMRLIKPLEAAAKKSYDAEMMRYLAD